jgi:hypothetical protein
MLYLEGREIAFREETRNITTAMLLLLQHSPSELSQDLQLKVLLFLKRIFQHLYQSRYGPGAPLRLLIGLCLNPLMSAILSAGQTCAPRSPP